MGTCRLKDPYKLSRSRRQQPPPCAIHGGRSCECWTLTLWGGLGPPSHLLRPMVSTIGPRSLLSLWSQIWDLYAQAWVLTGEGLHYFGVTFVVARTALAAAGACVHYRIWRTVVLSMTGKGSWDPYGCCHLGRVEMQEGFPFLRSVRHLWHPTRGWPFFEAHVPRRVEGALRHLALRHSTNAGVDIPPRLSSRCGLQVS